MGPGEGTQRASIFADRVDCVSAKADHGTVYVADSHRRAVNITMNGHTRLRFEKDGRVGDYIHILDDSGKDIKLHIVGKIAPAP